MGEEGGGYDNYWIGSSVWITDGTGWASDGATVITKAQYVSAALDGIAEDGSEVKVCFIDMPGGF